MITNEPAYDDQSNMDEELHPDVQCIACPKCVPVTFKAKKGAKKRKTGE